MKISLIVAHGNNYEIGLNNSMLWHIPEDFKNFKNITSNHHILMGRKTFESIGKPLPNRTSVVISNNCTYSSDYNICDNVIVFNDILKAIEYVKEQEENELFIIGGASIYKEILNIGVDKMYISEVDYNGPADAYFPKINMDEWICINEVVYEQINDVPSVPVVPHWKFKVYEKIRK